MFARAASSSSSSSAAAAVAARRIPKELAAAGRSRRHHRHIASPSSPSSSPSSRGRLMAMRTKVDAAAAEGATPGATTGATPAAARRPIVGHIPGFRTRVAECNEITPEDIARYVPLVVAGVPVGLMVGCPPPRSPKLPRHLFFPDWGGGGGGFIINRCSRRCPER